MPCLGPLRFRKDGEVKEGHLGKHGGIVKKASEAEYPEAETQRRFGKLVRTALNTPPKPMKDMPRKRPGPKAGPEKAARPSRPKGAA